MIPRRILSLLLTLSALLAAVFPYTDTFTPDTFPIIGIDEKADGAVRIMSYNIRGADVNGTNASRRRLIALEEILRVSPDSLGVQEAKPMWMFWLRLLPGYGIVGKGRDGFGRGEHCPVLYNRRKYKLVDSDTFWLSETPDEVSFGWDADCRRVCTWAVLENRQDGTRYVHVNTHFDHVGEVAVEQSAKMIVSLIAERFSDLPIVFTADLNAKPNSASYRIMTQALTDTRLASPDSKSLPYTYHDGKPEKETDWLIDYILCSADVTPLTYRTVTEGVNGRVVSDHFPIYADVQLPAK